MFISISRQSISKLSPVFLFISAIALSGCVAPRMPTRWSGMDPTDPTASSTGELPYRPTLIAETKRYIDPSVGREVTQMNHGMPGMGSGGMQGMDHSKMTGMKSDDDMTGMDHNSMPGTMPEPGATGGGKQNMNHGTMSPMNSYDGSKGEDSREMPAMAPQTDLKGQTPSRPLSANIVMEEMKKTSDEMKKMADELKAKSDAMKRSQ